MTNVILAPVSEGIFDVGVSALEPQMVRIRSQNNGFLYLDSKIRNAALNNSILSSDKNQIILAHKIRRWSTQSVYINYDTPNVNLFNNQITFFDQVAGVNFTALIPEGYYLTQTIYMTALRDAMNATASAIVFSFAFALLSEDRKAIITGTTNWNFVADDFLTRNRYMFGPPILVAPTPKLAWDVGTISLIYSRYIDFESRVMSEYTKAPSSSNQDNVGNVVIRIHFTEITPRTILAVIDNSRWINYNRDRQMTNIDIEVFDEWNNPFYFPKHNFNDDTATRENQDWMLDIMTEI